MFVITKFSAPSSLIHVAKISCHAEISPLAVSFSVHSALHVACVVDTWLDQNNSHVIIAKTAVLLFPHPSPPPSLLMVCILLMSS